MTHSKMQILICQYMDMILSYTETNLMYDACSNLKEPVLKLNLEYTCHIAFTNKARMDTISEFGFHCSHCSQPNSVQIAPIQIKISY